MPGSHLSSWTSLHLLGEGSRVIELLKSVVYFNRRFNELSDMVDDMKAILLGALDYEHVNQEFISGASERLTKAFQELDDQTDPPEGSEAEPVIVSPRKKQKGEEKLEKKPHLVDEIRAGRLVPFAWARVTRGTGPNLPRGMSGGRCQLMDTLAEREWGYPVKFSKSRGRSEGGSPRARPSSEGRGEGTFGGVVPSAKSILRGEYADRDRERAMSEATRIRLESDLLTLQLSWTDCRLAR
ncbi:hypothetical protein AAC387_Pa02g1895 [Persea americana]